ncbi:hypothetical protein PVAP13_1NG191100 [Panicum virgatum]|uniref:Uncharacterized protein n=1 Tax=Panicum virgatum TaxID=38727 RepID=A0A8T0WY41_PANVG|nr:hypothetical protein PVAP13_1NG191100 [Panicum virgatum]
MQLKHLACVLAKDLLILMEAYCLCCNSLVLDVRLVRTKANLYIPIDLCFRSLWYEHIFLFLVASILARNGCSPGLSDTAGFTCSWPGCKTDPASILWCRTRP